MKRLSVAVTSLLVWLSAVPALAQVVHVVVPFPVGGPLDTVARVVAAHLQATSKETYVVENRPGANGSVGGRAVAQAKPDGMTWLFADGALVTVNPKIYPSNAAFHADKELKPVAGIAMHPSMLVVRADSSLRTLSEFVARARETNLRYASGGNGSTGHLTMERLSSEAGIKLTHVPYTGAAPAMLDLMSGQVDVAFMGIGGVIGHVQSGKLRALAISSPSRVAVASDVPTVRESGLRDFNVQGGYFVMLPAATPARIVKDIEDKVLAAASDPGVQKRLRTMGLVPNPMGAKDASDWLHEESQRMAKLIESKGIRIE